MKWKINDAKKRSNQRQGESIQILQEKVSIQIRIQGFILLYISGIKFFASFQRPLLVLVDRNVDLATPLHHTWTYQALTHDVLNLSLNRITLTEQDPAHPTARSKTKEYDLNDADNFWATHKGIQMHFSYEWLTGHSRINSECNFHCIDSDSHTKSVLVTTNVRIVQYGKKIGYETGFQMHVESYLYFSVERLKWRSFMCYYFFSSKNNLLLTVLISFCGS